MPGSQPGGRGGGVGLSWNWLMHYVLQSTSQRKFHVWSCFLASHALRGCEARPDSLAPDLWLTVRAYCLNTRKYGLFCSLKWPLMLGGDQKKNFLQYHCSTNKKRLKRKTKFASVSSTFSKKKKTTAATTTTTTTATRNKICAGPVPSTEYKALGRSTIPESWFWVFWKHEMFCEKFWVA